MITWITLVNSVLIKSFITLLLTSCCYTKYIFFPERNVDKLLQSRFGYSCHIFKVPVLFSAVSVPQDRDKDVLSFTQDCLCGRSLPVHGRVLPAADWVWHADQEPLAGCDSSGSSVQISLDVCDWVLHGVLPDTVRRLPHQETGECMETGAVYRCSHY